MNINHKPKSKILNMNAIALDMLIVIAANMCIFLINNTTLRAELMAQYGAKLQSITNPTK